MKTDAWTLLMNEAQQTFLGEITVPRISVSTVLAEWARVPFLHAEYGKGHEPLIFVVPPRFDNEQQHHPFYGWFVLEWAFQGVKAALRYRVYVSLNPEKLSPSCVLVDEHFTPSQTSYCAILKKHHFLTDLEESFSQFEWLEQRDPRLKSRHDIPTKLCDPKRGLMPPRGQILDGGHKLSCTLMKTVYDTMPLVKKEDLDEFITLSDITLAPVYMPMSSNVSFVSDIQYNGGVK